MKPFLPEVFIQHLHRSSYAITAGHKGVNEIGIQYFEFRITDKLPDDMGRLPTVNGKAETQSFAFLQLIPALALLHLLGDEEQSFPRFLRQSFCRPSCIACTREIENHGGKGTNKRAECKGKFNFSFAFSKVAS
jgi:hypothetical protein